MTPDQMATLHSNGNFDISNVAYLNDPMSASYDPAKYASIQSAIADADKRIKNQTTLDTLAGNISNIITNSKSAQKAVQDATDEFKEALDSPEIKGNMDKITVLNSEIE